MSLVVFCIYVYFIQSNHIIMLMGAVSYYSIMNNIYLINLYFKYCGRKISLDNMC